jgi:pseudaminic acid synthase
MLYFNKLKRCYIIAEISANHGQDFDYATKMIKSAKECGADAVKFQCYSPNTMTINCNNEDFKIKHPKWNGQTLYQLYEKAYIPWNWLEKLKKISDNLGILFFATSFDKTSVDFLESLNVPIHKIASFELVDLPLIEYIAKTKKPLILSTGMATFREIEEAIDTAKKAGAQDIALLKCVSDYPAKYEDMNLKTIPDMISKFKVSVGLSDHTSGIASSIAAVCLGAKIVEKHFTISRRIQTPDSFFSIEPKELKELVDSIRIVEKSLGRVYYGPTYTEKRNRMFRRSLYIVKDIKKGEKFNSNNVQSIRPGYGLKPSYLRSILGKKSKINQKKGTALKMCNIKA